jgi:hypothetical protein
VSQGKDGVKGIVIPPMQLAAITVESIRQLNDRASKAETPAEMAEARAAEAEAKNKDMEERIERLENMQGLTHRIAWWQSSSIFGFAFGGFVIGEPSSWAPVESATTKTNPRLIQRETGAKGEARCVRGPQLCRLTWLGKRI